MGRIKTQLIKSAAVKLVETHGEKFTKDFKDNKVFVTQFAGISSKKLKNAITGYVTRLIRMRKLE